MSTLDSTVIATLQGGTVGLSLSALLTAISPHSLGPQALFIKFGGIALFPAAAAGTFTFLSGILRGKTDLANPIAACSAGFLAGVRKKSVGASVAGCAAFGAAAVVMDFQRGVDQLREGETVLQRGRRLGGGVARFPPPPLQQRQESPA